MNDGRRDFSLKKNGQTGKLCGGIHSAWGISLEV